MNKEVPLDEILDGLHPSFQTAKLKDKLFKAGIKKNVCEECGISVWNNKHIVMHLDHINGKSDDHRLDNLRVLCPNCHSQTDTYAGKNVSNERRIKIEEKKQLRRDNAEKIKQEQERELEAKLDVIRLHPKGWGWVKEVAVLLGISHTHVRRLATRHLPEIAA